MRYVIAGGTGFIGQYLVNAWLNEGIEITVIGRDKQKIQTLFGQKVQALTWYEFEDRGHATLAGTKLVLNLAGANIGEARWSEARRETIVESRSKTTKLIGQTCASMGDKSPPLFNASAIGIYGLQADEGSPPFDEYSEIDFSTAPDFLAQVARIWEMKTNHAKAHGVHVVNLRFAVVLGAHSPVLQKLSLPFKVGLGGPIGNGKQLFSWIHIADLKRAIDFLLSHTSLVGPVNFVAPDVVTQRQFATLLGHKLHKPSFFPTPGWLLKLIYGDMAKELLLQGQHVLPMKLLNEGFEFQFPTLGEALEARS